MRRVLPDPGPADPRQLLAALDLGARAPADRPYMVANFVSSVDGRASVDGGSTGLGDDGDREVFRALRGCADAVLAGTGTIGAEHYGTLARDPAVVALRAQLGLAAQPPLVTVTRSGSVPAIPLLDDPAATLIVYTAAELTLDAPAATVHVERRDSGELTMPTVLGHLRSTYGVRLLLCEGGPRIFGELVSEQVCDELFLTLDGKLAGGADTSITSGLQLVAPLDLELRWALEQDGSLYLRYGLIG